MVNGKEGIEVQDGLHLHFSLVGDGNELWIVTLRRQLNIKVEW